MSLEITGFSAVYNLRSHLQIIEPFDLTGFYILFAWIGWEGMSFTTMLKSSAYNVKLN